VSSPPLVLLEAGAGAKDKELEQIEAIFKERAGEAVELPPAPA
jgi:hypothetical protein